MRAQVGDALKTPDLSRIVSEIVALPGWAAGKPMGILFGHTAGSGARWVEASEQMDGIQTPALVFEVAASCDTCATTRGQTSVIDRADGAEETVSDGAMYLDSSDYELMHDGSQQVFF